MRCSCGGRTSVIKTQELMGVATYRRRFCDTCKKRFSTVELPKEFVIEVMNIGSKSRENAIKYFLGGIDGRRRKAKRD